MKYDDASWHYGGEFPDDLPDEAGATHIGMFVAWATLSGLAGSIHTEESSGELEGLRKRETTPGEFLVDHCDEEFTDEDLSDEGNAFAAVYYDGDDAAYLDDYGDTLAGDLASLYEVPDTWENYDLLRPVLDARYREWKAGSASDPAPARTAVGAPPRSEPTSHRTPASQPNKGCAVLFAAAALGAAAVLLLTVG